MTECSRVRHRRLPSPRSVKIHLSYTVEEVARLLGVHKNTVREWLRRGLPALTDQRPTLILGRELAPYLEKRRKANKRPCKPGQIFCVRCRTPQYPDGGFAEYKPFNDTGGNLVGLCPKCNGLMNRRVSLKNLARDKGDLEVVQTQAREHISKGA